MNTALADKLDLAKAALTKFGSAAVAFSGGVDSSALLAIAADALGVENVLAVTVTGPAMVEAELHTAREIAAQVGVKLVEISVNPLKNEKFAANDELRCYHCKKMILGEISQIAVDKKLACIATGSNAEDTGDYRPGSKAEKEFGVICPLQLAGLHKNEVRQLAKFYGLNNFNMPSAACLVSRVPYYDELTEEKLARIASGENYLKSLGFGQLRIRDHGNIARIEVSEDQIGKLVENREKITEKLKLLGYLYITADLSGFKSGSMNDAIETER